MQRISSGCLATLVCILMTGSFGVLEAFAAPSQEDASAANAPAAQKAEFVDEQGNKVEVTTFADGTMAVSVNNAPPVSGVEAVALLSTYGITLFIDGQGVITQHRVSGNTKVVTAPRPVTPAEAAAAAAEAEAAPAATEATESEPATPAAQSVESPVLPANVAAGSGAQISAAASESPFSSSTESNLNEKPVSQ